MVSKEAAKASFMMAMIIMIWSNADIPLKIASLGSYNF